MCVYVDKTCIYHLTPPLRYSHSIHQTTYFDAASSRKCPTTQQRARIGQATTLDELHNAVGEDFYCVVPCRPARPNSRNSKTSSSSSSSNKQGQVEGAREGEGEGKGKKFEGEEFEGTRLTLLKTQDPDPPGFDFSIRTPGTPLRWTQFAAELQHQFTSMMDLLSTLHSRPADIDTGIDIYTDVDVDVYARADKDIDAKIQKSKGNGSEVIIDTEALLRHALTFFYYWVTFAPLSRGSAACGYAVLHSMLLAGGYELTTSTGKNTFMKRGVQLDWEAILVRALLAFLADGKKKEEKCWLVLSFMSYNLSSVYISITVTSHQLHSSTLTILTLNPELAPTNLFDTYIPWLTHFFSFSFSFSCSYRRKTCRVLSRQLYL